MTQTHGDTGVGAGARILLVEDDALSMKLMRDVLEAKGYAIVQATNGAAGLAIVREQLPNLIVMDIGLPVMDGVEVTRALKTDRDLASIPILAVTAYAMPGDEARMRSTGCDAFLTKPLSFSEFVSVVENLLVGQPGGPVTGKAK